jgi:putative glutamine amidotransferase
MKTIGIPLSTSKTQYYINQAYVDYVVGAGMAPILIAPSSGLDLAESMCDGLLLPGGVDLEPTYYRENNIASYNVDPEKDEFERKLLFKFISAEKPIFGICRGLQLIVREYLESNPKDEKWLGYFQHISGHSLVDKLSIPRTVCSHQVKVRSDLYGGSRKETEYRFTNSMHHQAILKIGKRPQNTKIQVVATTDVGLSKKEIAAGIRVVEGIRIKDGKANILAVQWHAEELKDYALLQNFFGVDTDKDLKAKAAGR